MMVEARDQSKRALQSILDLQRRWVEALIRADAASLDAILEDTYVDTDESGSRFDKLQFLRRSNRATSS